MFSQKKGKADITPGNPQFFVKYVGKTEVFTAAGKGCTHRPVQVIWDSSEEERYLKKMSLLVNATGLSLASIETKKEELMHFDIKDISYCCAEIPPHDLIFAWICKNKAKRRLECHAVLCSSREKAQSIAVILSRSFQIAYKDWKSNKEKESRMKQSPQVGTKNKGHESKGEFGSKDSDSFKLDADEEAALNAALQQMNFVEEAEIVVHNGTK